MTFCGLVHWLQLLVSLALSSLASQETCVGAAVPAVPAVPVLNEGLLCGEVS